MYSINEWYYFIGALDKNTCNKIRNVAKDMWGPSLTNTIKDITDEERKIGTKRIPVIDKTKRTSELAWTTDKWIYDIVLSYMEEANELAGWKYDIRAAEMMQISRYKKDEFFGFHKDGMGDHLSVYDRPDNKHIHGYVRKLSMTVLLNSNYEGGEFQFAAYQKGECTIDTPEFNKTGSIIVFPSDMEHRVAPVTKGIRYSLVTWFLGPPFK